MPAHVPDVRLSTARLDLRPLERADMDALCRHWNLPEVRRYLWDGISIPREHVQEIVEESQALFATEGAGLWGLRLRAPDAFVGCGGFWYFRDPPERELVMSLSPEWWGKGLAAEAGRALITYAFETLHWREVQGSTDTLNEASVRLMDRLGFRFHRRATLQGLDTVVCTLSQEEWSESRPHE